MERFKVTDVADYESKANGYSYTTCVIEDTHTEMSAMFKGEVFNGGSKLNLTIERVDIPAFASSKEMNTDYQRWIESSKAMIGFLLNGKS